MSRRVVEFGRGQGRENGGQCKRESTPIAQAGKDYVGSLVTDKKQAVVHVTPALANKTRRNRPRTDGPAAAR